MADCNNETEHPILVDMITIKNQCARKNPSVAIPNIY